MSRPPITTPGTGSSHAGNRPPGGTDEERRVEKRRIEDRDHDLRSSLLAIDAGVRAVANRVSEPSLRALIDSVRLELRAAQWTLRACTDDVPEAGEEAGCRAGGDGGGVDLAVLVERWAELERATRGELRVCLPASLPVRFPSAAVIEVLRNLLDNARAHAPGASVRIAGWRRNGHAEVVVSDDGPGIDDPQAALQRGHAAGARSGLGLPNAHRLMREGGGELAIGTPRQGGTAIVLRFPLADDDLVRPR